MEVLSYLNPYAYGPRKEDKPAQLVRSATVSEGPAPKNEVSRSATVSGRLPSTKEQLRERLQRNSQASFDYEPEKLSVSGNPALNPYMQEAQAVTLSPPTKGTFLGKAPGLQRATSFDGAAPDHPDRNSYISFRSAWNTSNGVAGQGIGDRSASGELNNPSADGHQDGNPRHSAGTNPFNMDGVPSTFAVDIEPPYGAHSEAAAAEAYPEFSRRMSEPNISQPVEFHDVFTRSTNDHLRGFPGPDATRPVAGDDQFEEIDIEDEKTWNRRNRKRRCGCPKWLNILLLVLLLLHVIGGIAAGVIVVITRMKGHKAGPADKATPHLFTAPTNATNHSSTSSSQTPVFVPLATGVSQNPQGNANLTGLLTNGNGTLPPTTVWRRELNDAKDGADPRSMKKVVQAG